MSGHGGPCAVVVDRQGEVAFAASKYGGHGRVGIKIHVFAIHRVLEPFDEHIVAPAAAPVHANRDMLWRPRYWPAVSAFLVGIDGTIWLRQAGPPAPTARFWQLSVSGDKVEAQVELPRGLTLVRASRTHLWGWSLDEDEVPIVQRWRVPREGTRPPSR